MNTLSGEIFMLSAESPSGTWIPLVLTTISDAVTAAIAALPINNSAASAPGVGNDNTEGYSVFSLWIDTTGPDIYMATGVGTGAAAWKLIFDAVP